MQSLYATDFVRSEAAIVSSAERPFRRLTSYVSIMVSDVQVTELGVCMY